MKGGWVKRWAREVVGKILVVDGEMGKVGIGVWGMGLVAGDGGITMKHDGTLSN